MEENKGQEKTPSPEQDIIEGLFGEQQETQTKTPQQTQETPKETPKQDTQKDDKVDVQLIVKQAVSEAVEQIKPLINQSANTLTRQQQLNNWFSSEDGRMFLQYRQYIEKAALDHRFTNLRIDQLPAAVLKPTAYAKVLTDAKEAADKAAKDGITGGTGSARPTNTGKGNDPDYKNMSREDFQKVLQENQRKMIRR